MRSISTFAHDAQERLALLILVKISNFVFRYCYDLVMYTFLKLFFKFLFNHFECRHDSKHTLCSSKSAKDKFKNVLVVYGLRIIRLHSCDHEYLVSYEHAVVATHVEEAVAV